MPRVLDPILQAFNVMLPLDLPWIAAQSYSSMPVSLKEFYIHYTVDDEDQAHLMKLKVQPGDRCVEKLDHEDWQGHAGFAKLTWEDFLAKHKIFVSDVKTGKWDAINGERFD